MNTKSAFIITAAILVTSTLIIGLSAAQPASAKKVTQYCASFPTGGGLIGFTCKPTLQECEDARNALIQSGFQPTECSEQRSKVEKAK